MSYILDALKKSESERQQGKAPGVSTVQPYQSLRVKRRRIWPYMLVIALVLNAGVVLLALRPWEQNADPPPKTIHESGRSAVQDTKPLSPAPKPAPGTAGSREKLAAETAKPADSIEPAKAANPAASSAPAVENGPSAPAASPPVAVSKGSAAGGASPTVTAEAPKGMTPRMSPAPDEVRFASKRRERPGRAPDTTLKEATASKPTLGAGPQPGSKPAEARSHPAAAAPAQPVEKAQRTPPAPAAAQEQLPPVHAAPPGNRPRQERVITKAEGLHELHNMPAGIRNEVPRLTFSFLVYSDRPEDRMVTINGKRMREGEEVTAGLRLEEITPEGAILSWKGQRFHKSVF